MSQRIVESHMSADCRHASGGGGYRKPFECARFGHSGQFLEWAVCVDFVPDLARPAIGSPQNLGKRMFHEPCAATHEILDASEAARCIQNANKKASH